MSFNLDLIKDINAKVNNICNPTSCNNCVARDCIDCNALLVQVRRFADAWQLDFNTQTFNNSDFWNVQALIEYVEEGLLCNGDCEKCDNITLCHEIDNFTIKAYLHLQNIFKELDKK